MRRVLSTNGAQLVFAGATTFGLPKQGRLFKLVRVTGTWFTNLALNNKAYVILQMLNGQGDVIAQTESAEFESTGIAPLTTTFTFALGCQEFRTHLSGPAQAMASTPLGADPWQVESNNTLQLVFQRETGAIDAIIGTIFWHLDFDNE